MREKKAENIFLRLISKKVKSIKNKWRIFSKRSFCNYFGRKIQVFFQGQPGKLQISGQFPGDVANVPGFVRNAGEGFFILGIAENETVKRSIAGKPFSLGSEGKFGNQFHADGRTGEIQGKTALVFAGARGSNIGTASVNLLLAFVRSVTGNPIETKSFLTGGIHKAKRCLGGPFFQKALGITRKGIEGNADIYKVFGNVVRWKRVRLVDQASVISLHKNPPFFTSFIFMKNRSGI